MCCFAPPRRRPHIYNPNSLQAAYRTPTNSDMLRPLQRGNNYSHPYATNGRPVTSRPFETVHEECCPAKRARRDHGERRRHHRLRMKESDSTSDDYMYEENGTGTCQSNGIAAHNMNCCPCMANLLNPMYCPCQQMNCSCLQNICCSCVRNLQKSLVQNVPIKEKSEKKRTKASKCNCTQTKTESKDKAVVTNMIQVSDACVCCKPKKTDKRVEKQSNKTCIICKRPNVCTARYCPCILQMGFPNNLNGDNAANKSEDSNQDDVDSDTKGCDRNNCPHILTCGRNEGCTTTDCPKLNRPINRTCQAQNRNYTCYNTETSKNMDWFKNNVTDEKYPLTSNLAWLDNLLAKRSLPNVKYSYINKDNQFTSQLTGNTYNLNMIKINDTKRKNYKSLEPLPTDETIEELKEAVARVKGDPEHRNLVTAVCDALLNNRTKSSFEGGDSSFLDEYTFKNSSDFIQNELYSFDLHNKIASPYNEKIRYNKKNNFTHFAQTDSQLFNQFSPTISTTAATPTLQPNTVNMANKQAVTDPINSFFNEKTQTEVDQLFEEYMKKNKYSKLFSNQRDEDCQVQHEETKIPAETYCQLRDLGILKDVTIQYDKNLDDSFHQFKNEFRKEKIQTSIPVVTLNHSQLEENQVTNETKGNTRKIIIEAENGNQSDMESKSNTSDLSSDNANINISGGHEGNKSSNNKVIKVKRKRSASKAVITKQCHSTEKVNKYYEIFGHPHHCLSDEEDVMSLSIHSPLNLRSHQHEEDLCIAKSSPQIPSSKTTKSLTAADSNSKKRKILPPKFSKKTDLEKKYLLSNVSESDRSKKFKSKIPVMRSTKLKSANSYIISVNSSQESTEIHKQLEATVSSPSCIPTKSGNHEEQVTEEDFTVEDLYVSNIARNNKLEREKTRKDMEHTNYNLHNKKGINNIDQLISFDQYIKDCYNDSRHDLVNDDNENNVRRSASSNEVVISNIKYDSEDSMNNEHLQNYDDLLEEFSLNLSAENHKSVLSIIKEETESDVNVNKPLETKFLDINTSPFNFEFANHNYVDSCNSPFEIRKAKEKKLSLGLLCFSSHEDESDPYKAAEDGSASSEPERPRTARGMRWLF